MKRLIPLLLAMGLFIPTTAFAGDESCCQPKAACCQPAQECCAETNANVNRAEESTQPSVAITAQGAPTVEAQPALKDDDAGADCCAKTQPCCDEGADCCAAG
jgi:hypothetical protein